MNRLGCVQSSQEGGVKTGYRVYQYEQALLRILLIGTGVTGQSFTVRKENQ